VKVLENVFLTSRRNTVWFTLHKEIHSISRIEVSPFPKYEFRQ